MFLVNMRYYICFILISLIGFAVCVVLSQKFVYFRSLRRAYVYSGMICSVQTCFIDCTLCSLVQLKNFTFGYCSFYSLNALAACGALVSMPSHAG